MDAVTQPIGCVEDSSIDKRNIVISVIFFHYYRSFNNMDDEKEKENISNNYI